MRFGCIASNKTTILSKNKVQISLCLPVYSRLNKSTKHIGLGIIHKMLKYLWAMYLKKVVRKTSEFLGAIGFKSFQFLHQMPVYAQIFWPGQVSHSFSSYMEKRNKASRNIYVQQERSLAFEIDSRTVTATPLFHFHLSQNQDDSNRASCSITRRSYS